MKLVHPILSSPICFHENRVQVLVIENAEMFRSMVTDLVLQSEGNEGAFVLSEKDRCIECSGHLNVFMDYVHLHEPEKRIQTKVFSALIRNTQEDMAKDTFQLFQMIQTYLGKLAMLAEFPVAYEQSENIPALLKAMDFRIDLNDISACEALYEQMALISRVLKDQCFVLVNAKAFFSSGELEKLYQMAHYQKLNLLLLESSMGKRLPSEEICLFDDDLCELRLDEQDEIV